MQKQTDHSLLEIEYNHIRFALLYKSNRGILRGLQNQITDRNLLNAEMTVYMFLLHFVIVHLEELATLLIYNKKTYPGSN